MNLHEVSVVPYHPSDKKTTTFSEKDLRKTLSQYVISRNMSRDTLQIYEMFLQNGKQHSLGYCDIYKNLLQSDWWPSDFQADAEADKQRSEEDADEREARALQET